MASLSPIAMKCPQCGNVVTEDPNQWPMIDGKMVEKKKLFRTVQLLVATFAKEIECPVCKCQMHGEFTAELIPPK